MTITVNGKQYTQCLCSASARDDGESMYYGLPLADMQPNLLKDMEDAFFAENSVDIAGCTNEEIGIVVFDSGKTALEISACDVDNCLVCDLPVTLTEDERKTLDRLAA